MRSVFFSGILCLSVSIAVFGQQPSPLPLPATQASVYIRPNKSERVSRYLKNMFGPAALGKRVFSSGISTWRNSPAEWGPHWDGFAKRFASSTGKSVITHTTAFALEEAFKLDGRYYRSSGGVGAKIKNALISPFIARDERGRKVFGFPRIVGTYAAGVIASETWYPKRYSWKDGMRSSTISLGTSALFNLVKELVHRH